MRSAPELQRQYATEEHLRVRIRTHEQYSRGESLEAAVDEVVALRPGEALLDVGTGPGEYPNRLFRAGHAGRLAGVDMSPGMIAKAREAGTDVQFTQADAQTLPFADGSFNVVTARHMLYHVPDVRRAIGEARRVLRPGGRFVAVTNAAGYMCELWQAVEVAVGDDQGFANLFAMRGSVKFNETTGAAAIASIFGHVQIRFCHGELVFASPEPVVRYLDSCRTLCNEDPTKWRNMLARFATEVGRRIGDGKWHITKRVALLYTTCD